MRAEDRVTVFWMLTTLCTLATLALGLAALIYASFSGSDPSEPAGARLVVEYARFSSAVTALLLLILTPIVLRMRTVPPPRAVTGFVLLVAAVSLTWAMLGTPGGTTSAPELPPSPAMRP